MKNPILAILLLGMFSISTSTFAASPHHAVRGDFQNFEDSEYEDLTEEEIEERRYQEYDESSIRGR